MRRCTFAKLRLALLICTLPCMMVMMTDRSGQAGSRNGDSQNTAENSRSSRMNNNSKEKHKDSGYRSGVYGANIGVYDEILDQTSESNQLLHDALNAPDWLVLAGQHHTRYETLSGQWRPEFSSNDQQLAIRTRLLLGIRDVLDPLRFTFEFQDSRVTLVDPDSFVTDQHVNVHDIQRLHFSLVSQNFLYRGLNTEFNFGRINLDIARGRWISRQSFLITTQAFDGLHWSVGDEDNWHVRTWFAEPVQIEKYSLDDAAPAHPNTVWGIYGESRQLQDINLGFMYIGHASASAPRNFHMLSMRVFSKKGEGNIHFELESAYQFGQVSAVSHFEHFQHGEIGYTLSWPWSPELLARFDYASPRLDPLYGRRSFDLIPTGIFGPFQRTNILSPGYRILVKPFEDNYIFVQHRLWWLADEEAPWANTGPQSPNGRAGLQSPTERAGLQSPTGKAGRFVGQTVELRLRWSLTDDLFFLAGYVFFPFGTFPKEVMDGPEDDHADYTYFGLETLF